MAVQRTVVQGGVARAVRNVHVGKVRQEQLRTLHSVIGGGNVQRGLPVLVASSGICFVLQQDL